MSYLYCPHCGVYQGSMGSDQCSSCGHDKELEDSQNPVLYCPNADCGVYLGSMGGTSCTCCGWPQQYKEQ